MSATTEALAQVLAGGTYGKSRSEMAAARRGARYIARTCLSAGGSPAAPTGVARARDEYFPGLTTSADVVAEAKAWGNSACAFARARIWHKRRGLEVPAEILPDAEAAHIASMRLEDEERMRAEYAADLEWMKPAVKP